MKLPHHLFFAALLFSGLATTRAQTPVSTATDKDGHTKIYKDRAYDKVTSAQYLKGTTTLVVVDKRATDYADALKKAFAQYWKYTPYKFIGTDEVSKYAGLKGFSFFMFVRDEQRQVTTSGIRSTPHGDVMYTGTSYKMPYLYYMSDSAKHRPGKGFFGAPDDYFVTYIFIIGVNGSGNVKDSSEDDEDKTENRNGETKITDNFAIADYCVPGYVNGNLTTKYAGAMLEKEHAVIPDLNSTVKNFEHDLEYMNKKKRELAGVTITETCSLPYKGYTLNYKMDIQNYEQGKNIWKNKTVLVNGKMLSKDWGDLLAGLIGMNENQFKYVTEASIDSARKAAYNDNTLIWDTCRNLNITGYTSDMIKSVDGMEMIGFNMATLKSLWQEKRPTAGISYTEKYGTKIDGNTENFKLDVSNYNGGKDCCKNKTLYINNALCNEFGRMALAGLLDMKDDMVKLVTDAEIHSILNKGDNDALLVMDTEDVSGNYKIATVNNIELLSLDKIAFDKICKYKRIGKPKPYEAKCDLLYNTKVYTFKFRVLLYGDNLKKMVENKSLYIDSTCMDELGREILADILGMDDSKVKRVSKAAINNIIKAGDNNSLLFTSIEEDDFNDYMISRIDGNELIGVGTSGYSKELMDDINLTGVDKWSERKKFSVKP